MNLKFKNAFDILLKKDYRKKYYFKNGEEEIIYIKKDFTIEFHKFISLNNEEIIEVILNTYDYTENLLQSRLFEKHDLIELSNENKSNKIEDKILNLQKFFKKNINHF